MRNLSISYSNIRTNACSPGRGGSLGLRSGRFLLDRLGGLQLRIRS